MLKYLWLSLVIIIADQISKTVMVNWLDLYETVPVMPFFNLTLAHNTGAAFSFLAGAGGWQRWFFVVLAAVISAVLIIWMRRLAQTAKLEAISLA
ncbi:MAG TPA: signal peptidase II, partial [Methylophaga sp.]|nr:signal peptidase II [Methylophaga sp.]